jgi:branched-subunit amino acid aminotransferase/4-amino-4-deoxychorismate lyase
VSLLEHEGWGHFTAMQVRGGRARGLGLHLSRLEAAHHEVYGRALSGQEVRVQDLASYDGMILCNSRGWAPVSRVDDLMVPQDEAFTGVIAAAIESCPWEEI